MQQTLGFLNCRLWSGSSAPPPLRPLRVHWIIITISFLLPLVLGRRRFFQRPQENLLKSERESAFQQEEYYGFHLPPVSFTAPMIPHNLPFLSWQIPSHYYAELSRDDPAVYNRPIYISHQTRPSNTYIYWFAFKQRFLKYWNWRNFGSRDTQLLRLDGIMLSNNSWKENWKGTEVSLIMRLMLAERQFIVEAEGEWRGQCTPLPLISSSSSFLCPLRVFGIYTAPPPPFVSRRSPTVILSCTKRPCPLSSPFFSAAFQGLFFSFSCLCFRPTSLTIKTCWHIDEKRWKCDQITLKCHQYAYGSDIKSKEKTSIGLRF